MREIDIEPKDLWGFYLSKKNTLFETMYKIAENKEYGIEIYLSQNDNTENPIIVVEADNIEVYSEVIVSPDDARKSCQSIYDKYLTSEVVNILGGLEENEPEISQEYEEYEIEERENELDIIVEQFILDVCSSILPSVENDIIQDCKEHFLEYLARKHSLRVYRPMFLEDEDGEEFYEEYPYEFMIFED